MARHSTAHISVGVTCHCPERHIAGAVLKQFVAHRQRFEGLSKRKVWSEHSQIHTYTQMPCFSAERHTP